MQRALASIFSMVCGENPAHLWSPGGEALPCCQRCTGFYIGALVSLILHAWLRQRMSRGRSVFHGVCLLQLTLFLFPTVLPDSAELRSFSGTLFGFGVVFFLWPAVEGQFSAAKAQRRANWIYAAGLAGTAAAVPVLGAWGGVPGGLVLCWLTVAGAVVLAGLAGANLIYCLIRGAKQLAHNQFKASAAMAGASSPSCPRKCDRASMPNPSDRWHP